MFQGCFDISNGKTMKIPIKEINFPTMHCASLFLIPALIYLFDFIKCGFVFWFYKPLLTAVMWSFCVLWGLKGHKLSEIEKCAKIKTAPVSGSLMVATWWD